MKKDSYKCKNGISKIIKKTPLKSFYPMSHKKMIEMLIDDGMHPNEAKKVSTQVRKGGPLYLEYKQAFNDKRFLQINGRPKDSNRYNLLQTKSSNSLELDTFDINIDELTY